LLLSGFNETLNFPDRFSEHTQNIKLHENPSSGCRVTACWRTDGRKEEQMWRS